MNLDPLPALPPGRRAYEQAKRLQRAKRRYLLSRVTVRREMEAEVLKFPTKEAD